MSGQAVTVNILGRNYRLTIGSEDEQHLREAANMINAQAKLYGQHYSYNDNQDLLSMVALSKITELLKIQSNLKYKDTTLIDKLNSIDSVLDSYLHPAQNSL